VQKARIIALAHDVNVTALGSANPQCTAGSWLGARLVRVFAAANAACKFSCAVVGFNRIKRHQW